MNEKYLGYIFAKYLCIYPFSGLIEGSMRTRYEQDDISQVTHAVKANLQITDILATAFRACDNSSRRRIHRVGGYLKANSTLLAIYVCWRATLATYQQLTLCKRRGISNWREPWF